MNTERDTEADLPESATRQEVKREIVEFVKLVAWFGGLFIALKTYPPHIGLQGASGVLYVMFGLWLSLYYKAEVHVPRGKRRLRIIGFCLVMMVPSEFSPQVSYRSHLFGLVVGLIAGIIYGYIAHEEFERRNHEYASESKF